MSEVGIPLPVPPEEPKQPEQKPVDQFMGEQALNPCLLYTSPSPRDLSTSRMPSSA